MRKSGASHPPKLEHSGLDQRVQEERRKGKEGGGAGEKCKGQGGSMGQTFPALSLLPRTSSATPASPAPGQGLTWKGDAKEGRTCPFLVSEPFSSFVALIVELNMLTMTPKEPYGSFSNLISSLSPSCHCGSHHTALLAGLGTQGLRGCPCSFTYSRSLCSGPCLSVTFSERPP